MRITPHFHRDEFDQRPWSGDKDGEDYPSKWIKERLTPLCEALEVLRAELDGKRITVISGYRSPEFNRAIKGAPLSQHCLGRAADIRVEGVPATRVWAVVMALVNAGTIPQIRGVGLYVRQNFVHLDVRPTVMLATWGGSFTPSEA